MICGQLDTAVLEGVVAADKVVAEGCPVGGESAAVRPAMWLRRLSHSSAGRS
jgi:hypothetical protein